MVTRKRAVERARAFSRRYVTSTFEITATCNLRCEGCLFFSGDHAYKHREIRDPKSWDTFFEERAKEGITFAMLAGAEPSLVEDRLLACQKHIPYGVVLTNGTKRISDSVRYRIHISLWGGDETTGTVRGGDLNAKAFRHYKNDPRAVFIYTINALNIDEIMPMVERCKENNVPISFNYFGATETYTENLASEEEVESDFFRISSTDDNLILSDKAVARASQVIRDAKARYPDTVLFSESFNDWVTQEGSIYDIGSDGIATNCSSILDKNHASWHVDQERSVLKCANPTFDCSSCKTYACAYPSYLRADRSMFMNSEKVDQWWEVADIWETLFIGDQLFAEQRAQSAAATLAPEYAAQGSRKPIKAGERSQQSEARS